MAVSKQELEALYRDLEIPLFNFALRWVFNPSLAEEVVHDAFLRVWDRRDLVDVPTLKGLLYKTTQNLALNEIHKRRVREAFPILDWLFDEPQASGEQTLIDQQDLQRMRIALEQLPQEFREVLLMSQYSDMSTKEIAKCLEIAEGTVGSRKNRALEMLRGRMSPKQDQELDNG